MQIEIVESYEELSQLGANLVLDEIRKNKSLLVCVATGNSPTGLYQLLGREYKETPKLFSEIRIVKLDEWGGLEVNHPTTCEAYIKKHLIRTIQISDDRYYGFQSNPPDPKVEFSQIQHLLENEGVIDLCILGLGMKGHLAFNEPAEFLQPECHIARLSPTSQQHEMASSIAEKPTFGFTLGIGDILKSRKILLLVSGENKNLIAKRFLSKKISTKLPASFLWLHPNTTCIIQNNLLKSL